MAAQGNTLHEEYRHLSSLAGYGVRQSGIVGALTTTQVTAATSAEDLVTNLDSVPGTVHGEYDVTALNAQRALQRGDAIADFTDARVQAATTVESLAQDTEVANDPDTGHLGPRM